MNFFKKTLCLFFCIFLIVPVYAWNALGHRVIAHIAYERLDPDVRKKIDKLVADFSLEYPEIVDFSHAAPWADSIKSQKVEISTHWHYVNLPFSGDGTAVKPLSDSDNVVWAIEKLIPVLANEQANRFERARALAYLIHIEGDLHQPLHTSSRITAEHPNGDQGGNLYLIHYPTAQSKTMSLHKFWDQGLDLFTVSPSDENVKVLSHKITQAYPEDYFEDKLKVKDFSRWAEEGYILTTSFVYQTPQDMVPNALYIQIGKEKVQEQTALAGYRLAQILNDIL